MKFEQLTEKERNNIKKHIKEDLKVDSKYEKSIQILNPNQLEYNNTKDGLKISGKIGKMTDHQVKSAAKAVMNKQLENLKDKLKKAA